ncbi:hypothetical protein GH714_013282 [Hevea brasiliensis]|uniref:K Homology domain-containing protein n=1 Tax=Hevea brasiliensis TaxID=3981 RepID=A0A6A6KNA1_HEVBR|nr:hypothetical protein GH714_013282 [Hevea brasiliensis]
MAEEEEADLSAEPDADKKADDVVDGDSPDAKRLRVDESKPDGLASENGFEGAKSEDHAKESVEEPGVENEKAEDAALPPSEGVPETTGKEEFAADGHDTVNTQQASVEDSKTDDAEEKEETEKHSEEDEDPASDAQTTSRKMEVPNDKKAFDRYVRKYCFAGWGLIGKGGDTIRYLQYNSGAKIQITRDADANPQSTTRPVEIIGTLSSIKKAEKLISAVIAEADGGSPSLVARGLPSAQTGGVGEQLEMQVPNEKVGLIIGRGGDTIKALQAKSGARIQLIPQHLPEGDGSKERTVRVTGDRKQIEMAREMIKDVMNQTVRSSPYSGSFNQQHSYRPRGSTGPSNWGPRGPHSSQPSPYDYHHRGPYPSQSSQYPPPSYGGYPPNKWAQEGGHVSDHPVSGPISTPVSGHAPGPSPTPAMSPPSQVNYNYGQPHGPDYGHQAPYSQAVPSQQSYGHGYDEPKLWGQQQYGKQPSYGMPSQGPPPQSYGPPRPSQPGDMPYQGPVQSSQSYGPNVPPQQQYPYASSGPMQQSYPSYGSASGAEGYNQAMPTSGPGYPQQGSQPVHLMVSLVDNSQLATCKVQLVVMDHTHLHNKCPWATYSAPPSGQQAYAQPTATQPSYDQSVPQSGAYGAAPGSAPVGYGKTLSPQPTYPQYDSTQMYVAPR